MKITLPDQLAVDLHAQRERSGFCRCDACEEGANALFALSQRRKSPLAKPSARAMIENMNLSAEAFDALETALSELALDWTILAGLKFDGPSEVTTLDFIALHPRRGVALIDAVTPGDPAIAGTFRMLLRSRGFERDFPGYLPIVHLRVRAAEAARLESHLEAAFAMEPAIGIVGGAWVEVLCTLLAAPSGAARRPVISHEASATRVPQRRAGSGDPIGRDADRYRSWEDLSDADREAVRARIESGELPKTFQVDEHRYYVGRRLPYLSPTPITRRH